MSRYLGEVEADLFLGQQNLVVLKGLKSALKGGASLDSATTTVSLQTIAEVELDAATMDYATGSAGWYEGTLPVVSSLVQGIDYLLKVTVLSAGTTVAFWNLRKTAEFRRE